MTVKQLLIWVLLLIIISACADVRVIEGPYAIGSIEPIDEITDADNIYIEWITEEPTESIVKIRVNKGDLWAVSDLVLTTHHSVNIGRFKAGDLVEYRVAGRDIFGNETRSPGWRRIIIKSGAPEIVVLPTVFEQNMTISCEVEGVKNIGGRLSAGEGQIKIINFGKLPAENMIFTIKFSNNDTKGYMCTDDGECLLRIVLSDSGLYQLDRDIPLELRFWVYKPPEIKDDLIPWRKYTAIIEIWGDNFPKIEKEISLYLIPEVRLEIDRDNIRFPNACGNEAATLIIRDKCGSLDLDYDIYLEKNTDFIKFNKTLGYIRRGESEYISVYLDDPPYPSGERVEYNDTILVRVGDVVLKPVPVYVSLKKPVVKIAYPEVKETITCGGEFEFPVAIKTDKNGGCLRYLDFSSSISGNFSIDVIPEEIRYIKPGKSMETKIKIKAAKFIEAKTYRGNIILKYRLSEKEIEAEKIWFNIKIPKPEIDLSESAIDFSDLRCGDKYLRFLNISETAGGCISDLLLNITNCNFDDSLLGIEPQNQSLGAYSTISTALNLRIPGYLSPDNYTCNLFIMENTNLLKSVPISFRIPYPKINVTFPDREILYKEMPPYVTGKTTLVISEVGGYTPLKNVSIDYRIIKCPTEEQCEEYGDVLNYTRFIKSIEKDSTVSIPIFIKFHFSDPRGDYVWSSTVAAGNTLARKSSRFTVELIPPTCKKVGEQITNIKESMSKENIEIIENLLKKCEKYQKVNPLKAARTIAVVSNFYNLRKKVQGLKTVKGLYTVENDIEGETMPELKGRKISVKNKIFVTKILISLRSIDRSIQGICSSGDDGEKLCKISREEAASTIAEVGRYFCMFRGRYSAEIVKNAELANIFLGYANKNCSVLDVVNNLKKERENVRNLKNEALAFRLNPVSADRKYRELLAKYRLLMIRYYTMGLTGDIQGIKQEYFSIKRQYKDFRNTWIYLGKSIGAILIVVLLSVLFGYIRYRLRLRRVATF